MTREHSRLALSIATERLEQALTISRNSLIRQQEWECERMHGQPCDGSGKYPHFAPEQRMDSNGRYILLDALVALVAAQTALVESA